MCGIAGLSLPEGMPVKAVQLELLGQQLVHRGPDGYGTFAAGNLGLVHRRLAIVDVAHGQQPFTSTDGSVALVANGEIYNHQLLRQRLARRGIDCATGSDCEPPLLAYGQQGLSALDDLEGMYGLAIADTTTGELVLARDPFGIKPLYYLQGSQGFAFASEPRALLALGWYAPQMARDLIPVLLAEHATPEAATMLSGIQRVLPGERLVVVNGQIISRYRLPLPLINRPTSQPADFAREFEGAVARHVATEVPMGLFLSGGIDSTALLIACHRLGIKLNTYTAYFASHSIVQSTPAALAARQYNLQHQDVCYTPENFWADLPEMAWCMDDPVLDYAVLPSLLLAKCACTDGVKVIFSGEGGDEILAGYKRYRLSGWQRFARRLAGQRRGGWARVQFYLQPPVHPPCRPHRPENELGFSRLQTLQHQSIAANLVDDLLPKLDRSLMRHGLEGRVPFLDDRFAAYSFNLADDKKVRPGYGKWLLRQYVADAGFNELAWRKKQGFTVPIHTWLTSGRPQLAKLWAQSPLLAGLLKPGAAQALLSQLPVNKNVAEPVFSLTVLALWHALHIESRSRGELVDILRPSPVVLYAATHAERIPASA